MYNKNIRKVEPFLTEYPQLFSLQTHTPAIDALDFQLPVLMILNHDLIFGDPL